MEKGRRIDGPCTHQAEGERIGGDAEESGWGAEGTRAIHGKGLVRYYGTREKELSSRIAN